MGNLQRAPEAEGEEADSQVEFPVYKYSGMIGGQTNIHTYTQAETSLAVFDYHKLFVGWQTLPTGYSNDLKL